VSPEAAVAFAVESSKLQSLAGQLPTNAKRSVTQSHSNPGGQ
jgi:hypothetical protein